MSGTQPKSAMNLLSLELIELVPMFQGFTNTEKKKIARLDNLLISFANGETIIHENEENCALFILLKGSVQIVKKDSPQPIATLNAGSIFGEMSFLTQKPRFNSVVACDDALVMKLDDYFFRKVDPATSDKIKNYLIEVLVHRLDTMNASLAKLSKMVR